MRGEGGGPLEMGNMEPWTLNPPLLRSLGFEGIHPDHVYSDFNCHVALKWCGLGWVGQGRAGQGRASRDRAGVGREGEREGGRGEEGRNLRLGHVKL